MAIIKCKMCGGDLDLTPDATTAECEYCGSVQTVPKVDDEKKLTLFARANRLRLGCEFDKASGIYESIVADFPEEAEAYWGLVLCKYGIEYVDDPGTGKKIPTCHRSSFDSLMDDSDFEQALENADSVARRVYRDEAKQIEEIRKGIIAVSAKEEPYDIFICYKETDENGDRTIDSVIAQDVYDALVEKGYRVFFARITLEDKLGLEYEPYIFAALNSAKIMLAMGTDYEYYNAVWVKNEWSRFLKLMANDKGKHLIPCFKGIDAYDMPKEFARLQAQDMGKIGAIQDLLRGIEKLLPRQKAPAAVTTGTEQLAANTGNVFVKRGFMALEDGAWKEADSFFDQALNQDAECAQAYLGKALAEDRSANLREFVRKRLERTETVQSVAIVLDDAPDSRDSVDNSLHFERYQHIQQMCEKYAVNGWFPSSRIQSLYEDAELTYDSEVSGRKRQLQEEEAFLNSHRYLNRAKQFSEEVRNEIDSSAERILSIMHKRVEDAENADKEKLSNLKAIVQNNLARIDTIVVAEHSKAIESWDKVASVKYKKACELLKSARTELDCRSVKQLFIEIVDYKDSKEKARQCQERMDNIVRAKQLEIRKEELLVERSRLNDKLDELGWLAPGWKKNELKTAIDKINGELVDIKQELNLLRNN